jgi:hypothetical protein
VAPASLGFSVQVEYQSFDLGQDFQSHGPKDRCLVCKHYPDFQSEHLQEFQTSAETENPTQFVVVFLSEIHYKRVFMVMQAIFLEIIIILS